MKIENLKDLKQVIKACREGGVTAIEVDNVKLTLLPKTLSKAAQHQPDYSSDIPEALVPVPKYRPMTAPTETLEQEMVKVTTDELSPEQLMMWSSAGNEQ